MKETIELQEMRKYAELLRQYAREDESEVFSDKETYLDQAIGAVNILIRLHPEQKKEMERFRDQMIENFFR